MLQGKEREGGGWGYCGGGGGGDLGRKAAETEVTLWEGGGGGQSWVDVAERGM